MRRLIVVGTMLLASAGWASAGWAADTTKTIDINPGSLGKKAEGYSQICDQNQGGNPPAGKDMWVFNLPSQGNNPGVFVSVTATWDTGSGSKTLTIPADGGNISVSKNGNATSKAWIAVPEGWVLIAASAVVTGDHTQFVVTHTCTKTGDTTPPTTAPPGGGDPDPDPDPSASASAGTPGGGGGSLPLTGTTTTVLLALGSIAIAGGAALRFLYRRRRPIV